MAARVGTIVKSSKPVALPRRLLSAIDTFEAEGLKWLMNGVTWEPMPCRGLTVVAQDDPCVAVTSTNPDYTCLPYVTQTPFRLYDAFSGSAMDFEMAEIEARLRERLPVMASDAFAHELISGDAGSTMSLSSEAHAPDDVAFGDTVTPRYAMSVLEAELARQLHGRQGLIHLTPGMLGQVVVDYGLEREGDHWVTPIGNKVITDSGYVDMDPPEGESDAAAGQDWAYASGPVTYQSNEPSLVGDAEFSFDRSTNKMLRWMDMFGILVFDPCPVTAVLVAYDSGLS